jgi:tRNA threonylcarbamoyladenosine biosynthesis protein TsaB
LMLLAIDTCGAVGGVALGKSCADPRSQNRDLGHPGSKAGEWSRELAGKTYSEQLLPAISEVLRDAGVALEDLSGVVVVHGPGSFTGIRVGVSAAKGLAEGLGIPVIALSRLELLARKNPEGSAVAILDAGRGEFYAGFYRERICETEALLTRGALSQALAGCGLPVLVCEPQVFSALEDIRPVLVAAPTAVDALRVGGERFRAGSFDDVSSLEANYLRRSESEMLARIAEHAARRIGVPDAATHGK